MKAQKKRILVLDDCPEILESLQNYLEHLGFAVTLSSDPHLALKILHSDTCRFDILITDFSMPEMSGTELIEVTLKSGFVFETIILLSGNPNAKKTLEELKNRYPSVTNSIYFLPKPKGIDYFEAILKK